MPSLDVLSITTFSVRRAQHQQIDTFQRRLIAERAVSSGGLLLGVLCLLKFQWHVQVFPVPERADGLDIHGVLIDGSEPLLPQLPPGLGF